MASRAAAWAAVLLFADISRAAPGISFPINSQVPPVARIGQPFSFVFSPSTFSSSSTLNYSLVDSPPWLSVDSAARRLFGTPSEADIGPGQVVGVPVRLVATDASGSATLETTLVVSRSPGPRVNLPLERQVPKFGVFSAPSSILSAPQTQFSFSLAPDTFVDPSNSPLNYYAVMADNTPLPAWISFTAGPLAFSGRTPPSESLIQPPQRFGFQIVASDVVGFAAASLQFDIIVGSDVPKVGDVVPDKHQLTADKTTISIDATAGTPLSYTGLQDAIKLDGKPATAENVVIASVGSAPPWLTVGKNTGKVDGTPPENAEPTQFVVTVQEKFSNTTLDLTIQIEVRDNPSQQTDIFKGDVPPLTAIPGESFSFDLSQYLSNPSDTELTFSDGSSPPWLRFDPKTAVISGDVPKDAPDSSLKIPIQAKSKISGQTTSLALTMTLLSPPQGYPSTPPSTIPSSSITSSTSSVSATPSTDSSFASTGDTYNNAPPNLMLLAVLLPVSILILSVTCLLFWCYRRRKEETESRTHLTTRDISGPLPGTFVRNDSYGPPLHTRDLDEAMHNAKTSSRSRGGGDSFNPSSREKFITEQKEYIQSRNTYMSNATIPRPQATVRLLPPIDGSPSDADDVFGTGTVPLLPPIKPLRLTRHELRNDRSLSSISETSFYENNVTIFPAAASAAPTAGTAATNDATSGLLGPNNGAGTPFRKKIEVHIPTYSTSNSITQTPESAYTAPRSSPMSAAGSYVSPHGSHEALRTQSRLGHYPQMPTATSRKFAWPWLKKTMNVGKAAKGVKAHARKMSVATVDTFAYKRAASTPVRGGEGEREMSPPAPRLMRPAVGGTTEASIRPVMRRGPVAGQGGRFSGEWCDETVMSQSMGSITGPNWTRAGVGESSPMVGQGLYLSGSKELGSELGNSITSLVEFHTIVQPYADQSETMSQSLRCASKSDTYDGMGRTSEKN
ncbi:hypothetical protein QBC34DRAFT_456371 [Podospora aff. communis PSN243]|uniref:Dystroglycan-type cadherin-like domain-containing protein n=1 Tax=Podospora aff. communis PSN243 TaxID=3040156 RepID=A0AAV9GXD6_9PEZI|nr:hypothetical protein QBC34DRAFT_456371 [Podospora aff. communis PSN243]